MASVPPVIMAGEQELNQQGIISQCAPGGNTASHATIAFFVGNPDSLETPHTTHPAASPWAIASVCARSHL